MAYGQSPFSEKTQWGPLLESIAGMIMQGMMVNKFGKQGGQRQLPPPTMPQQRTQAPINRAVQQAPGTMQGSPNQSRGNEFIPQGGMGGQPQGGQQAPEAAIFSLLASQPILQKYYAQQLKDAKFAIPKAQAGVGASGSATMGR